MRFIGLFLIMFFTVMITFSYVDLPLPLQIYIVLMASGLFIYWTFLKTEVEKLILICTCKDYKHSGWSKKDIFFDNVNFLFSGEEVKKDFTPEGFEKPVDAFIPSLSLIITGYSYIGYSLDYDVINHPTFEGITLSAIYNSIAKYYLDKEQRKIDNSLRRVNSDIININSLPQTSTPKWQRESQLFQIIQELFPGYEVIREASPPWLEKQRFDIYIPALNLAIEHQGEQHYRPVEIFGGERGFFETQNRDSLKYLKCMKNNTTLIYFTYLDELSLQAVAQKINDSLLH